MQHHHGIVSLYHSRTGDSRLLTKNNMSDDKDESSQSITTAGEGSLEDTAAAKKNQEEMEKEMEEVSFVVCVFVARRHHEPLYYALTGRSIHHGWYRHSREEDQLTPHQQLGALFFPCALVV